MPSRAGRSIVWLSVIGFVLSVMVALIVAVRVALPTVTERRVSVVAAPVVNSRAPSGLLAWSTYPKTVLLAAARGENARLFAEANWPDSGNSYTLVDAPSGKPLWHVSTGGISASLYSDGGDVLLASDATHRLTRFDPATGNKLWSVSLADEVYDITFGQDCAALLRPNGPLLTLSLKDAQPLACTPTKAPEYPSARDALTDLVAVSSGLKLLGSIQSDSKAVNPDPPRLAAELRRAGGQALWRTVVSSLEPVWTSDGFARSMTLTPEGVFVLGRSAEKKARWLLLDLGTGRPLYEHGSDRKVDSRIQLLNAAGIVYAIHDNCLDAYQLSTGAVAWSVGSE